MRSRRAQREIGRNCSIPCPDPETSPSASELGHARSVPKDAPRLARRVLLVSANAQSARLERLGFWHIVPRRAGNRGERD
jgi:hypothetical protein